jgi:hypothetical protein
MVSRYRLVAWYHGTALLYGITVQTWKNNVDKSFIATRLAEEERENYREVKEVALCIRLESIINTRTKVAVKISLNISEPQELGKITIKGTVSRDGG